jgi:hypothetical protein
MGDDKMANMTCIKMEVMREYPGEITLPES